LPTYNDSPWNHCAVFRDARNAADADLASIGDAELAKGQAKEAFSFKVLQVPGCLYGRDYFLGDVVTGRFEEIERNKRIMEVRVTVSGQEEIELELADV
jgi:hypothetical protein